MAQSVKHLTLIQVMISWFVGSSPTSGSVITAQSLEPASHSLSPSFSAPPQLALSLSVSLCLSLSKINKNIQKFFFQRYEQFLVRVTRWLSRNVIPSYIVAVY